MSDYRPIVGVVEFLTHFTLLKSHAYCVGLYTSGRYIKLYASTLVALLAFRYAGSQPLLTQFLPLTSLHGLLPAVC